MFASRVCICPTTSKGYIEIGPWHKSSHLTDIEPAVLVVYPLHKSGIYWHHVLAIKLLLSEVILMGNQAAIIATIFIFLQIIIFIV